ncbi:MAG TPA: hypothetical protein VKR38_05060 [Usitatibacter sp.]|nr:hypothetical protein [Usitatibacter sp.]
MADLDELAARKQLLSARAALQRLQVSVEIERLRDKSRWVGSVAGAALLLLGRRTRVARVLRWAAAAFALLRLFRR